MDFHSLFTVKYLSSEEGGQAFIRNTAIRFFFVCDKHADFFPLKVCHRKIKLNYPGNECFKQGDNLLTR